MAGIEENGDVGALRLLAEVEQPLRHLVARQVSAFNDFKADIAKRACDRLGVDRRVRQRGDVLVGAVADHEGDASLGLGGTRRHGHNDQGKD